MHAVSESMTSERHAVILTGEDIHQLFAAQGIDTTGHRDFRLCTESDGSGRVKHQLLRDGVDRLVFEIGVCDGKPATR